MKKNSIHIIIMIIIFMSLAISLGCQTAIRSKAITNNTMQDLPKTSELQLELFVMSQCPFGIEAEKAIVPILENFKDQVDCRIFFIAQTAEQFLAEHPDYLEKAPQTEEDFPEDLNAHDKCKGTPLYEGGKFVSLHGKSEVEEDIRQVVIMKYYPEKFWDYLLYRAENYETNNWEEAAARAWINIDHIRQISESEEGERLFAENIKYARELGITSSPTLLVDNQRYTGVINYNSLARLICSKTSRLRQCRNVPVCGHDPDCKASGKVGLCENPDTPDARCRFADPLSIQLSVIDIPHSLKEELNGIIGLSEQLFPSLVVERLEWDSEKAQELIRKYGISSLPALFYSKDIEQDLRYVRIKNGLIDKENGYLLNPQLLNPIYYPDREEKRGQLELFVEGLNQRDNQIIQQIQGIPQLKEALKHIHFQAKMENNAQPSPILSMRSDSQQPNVLILSPQIPKITFRSRRGLQEIQEDIRQLCIANTDSEKYWEYLACRSAQIINKNEDQKGTDWKICAQEAGLQTNEIEACSVSERGAQLLKGDIHLARELKITSNPSFLVNNKWVVKGENLNMVKRLFSHMMQ